MWKQSRRLTAILLLSMSPQKTVERARTDWSRTWMQIFTAVMRIYWSHKSLTEDTLWFVQILRPFNTLFHCLVCARSLIQIGQFFGEVDPVLMINLVNTSLYSFNKTYDYQSVCDPEKDSKAAAGPRSVYVVRCLSHKRAVSASSQTVIACKFIHMQ